ncbi:MAG: sulfate reduction electron transfer complex DsrMKJOP subunit DsrJ [Acidobacteriia bacterium]|nr:sulfate reduction electron transfer complex DsrMKJOP subunit DsrJ [Terriglobia bacterium]
MRDRVPIAIGLLLFVSMVTFPVWHAAYAKTTAVGPRLKLPERQKACVAPVAFMRASHMKLLTDWREGAVRSDRLTYTAYDGKKYRVNLSSTCLGECHTNKKEFCDRCHQYAAVSGPYCWDCHVDPTSVARRTP